MRLKSGEVNRQSVNKELQAFVEPTKSKISKERSLKVLQLETFFFSFDVFLFPFIVNFYEIVRKLIKSGGSILTIACFDGYSNPIQILN